MMSGTFRLTLLALTLALAPACAFSTTAQDWSGRVGASGRPVFYTATTKVGLNLFIGIQIWGDTAIDGMVNELTELVAERGGDRIRMVQGSSENYWYGFPPFTWIFTPVVSSVDATWEPSPEDFAGLYEEWATVEEPDED